VTQKRFKPRLDILPASQRRLWEELGATPPHFVLYGGTAIALRLGHRHSEDFDFFSNQTFAPRELLRSVSYLDGSVVRQEAPNTLTCTVNRRGRVLVSFFGGLGLKRVGQPERIGKSGVRVASLLDLAATKMVTIVQRASLKDYWDVDALLNAGLRLDQAISAARAVYGRQYDPLSSLRAIVFFEEGNVRQLGADVRKRLVRAAKSVDLGRLPVLRAHRGIA
jgi:hypothetical protein